MKILVACEYSGRVREAFRKLGHDAWSCDLLPSDDNSPYHIQGDVLELLDKGWDMMIAHPPCTYLANSGVQHMWAGRKKENGKNVALKLYNYPSHFSDYKVRREKFLNEPKIFELLKGHDHVVEAFEPEATTKAKLNSDHVEIDFYTMELMAGNLQNYLESHPDDWKLESKLKVISQVCLALEHSHEKRIFHRDLYTDNILVKEKKEPLHVKVTDYGAAKTPKIPINTAYDFLLGARNISSPEALVGLISDDEGWKKNDVFALGLLIYHIINKAPSYTQVVLMTAAQVTTKDPKVKEEHLKNKILPMIKNNMIVPLAITELGIEDGKKRKIEAILNDVFLEATKLDPNDRTSEISSIRTRMEECLGVLNA